MSVLDIPRPAPGLDTFAVCRQIEARLHEVDDVAVLHDTKAKLSAIDEYLAATARDGRAQVAATMRRLEVRIGEVLGEARNGGDRKSEHHDSDQLPREVTDRIGFQDRHRFREMAAHSDVVEEVIAQSSDDEPASRRKVLNAIKEKKGVTTPRTVDRSQDATRRRSDNIRHLAAEGHTSHQIAEIVGITPEGVRNIARRDAIDIPADRIVRGTKRLDAEKVVDNIVDAVEGLAMSLSMIDGIPAIDADKRFQWFARLREPLAALNRLSRELKQ